MARRRWPGRAIGRCSGWRFSRSSCCFPLGEAMPAMWPDGRRIVVTRWVAVLTIESRSFVFTKANRRPFGDQLLPPHNGHKLVDVAQAIVDSPLLLLPPLQQPAPPERPG